MRVRERWTVEYGGRWSAGAGPGMHLDRVWRMQRTGRASERRVLYNTYNSLACLACLACDTVQRVLDRLLDTSRI